MRCENFSSLHFPDYESKASKEYFFIFKLTALPGFQLLWWVGKTTVRAQGQVGDGVAGLDARGLGALRGVYAIPLLSPCFLQPCLSSPSGD